MRLPDHRSGRRHAATGSGAWSTPTRSPPSADEPGLVIRNEDVFIEKVRERVALAEAIGHLLSPVLLLADRTRRSALHAALAAAVADARRRRTCRDVDPAGRTHEIWPVPAGTRRDELLALAGGGELVVADGNHRSLAAQTAGLPALPGGRHHAGVGRDPAVQPAGQRASAAAPAELIARLRAAGATVDGRWTAPPACPTASGTIHVYAGGRHLRRAAARVDPAASAVDNLDHALVERILLRRRARPRRRATSGSPTSAATTPPTWLAGEVDAGRAELAVLIAPVTVDDFVAVNLARQKLPRKSTWFTPKARAGLVAAEL